MPNNHVIILRFDLPPIHSTRPFIYTRECLLLESRLSKLHIVLSQSFAGLP